MTRKSLMTTAAAVSLIGAMATPQARAADGNDAEIAALKQQLQLMEQKLEKLQKQSTANAQAAARANEKVDNVANANAAIPVKAGAPASGVVVTMPNNRPTICTADNANCVAITSRVHWDVGGYDYRPNTAATSPQRLDSGDNLRRARIGIIGKFFNDWNYALIYDFGGSSDGFGGAAPGSLPGGGVSGVENAYLSYTGIKPFGGKLAIEGGIMDIPYTLDEATSSNDILFMERASSGVIAQNIAAGDFRSTIGTRWWNDVFWAGAYVTGPTTGAIHSASSTSPVAQNEQLGVAARAAGQIVSGKDYSFHLGGDFEDLIQPAHSIVNGINGAQTLTLNDRPELRIDPTSLISTGAIANVSSAQVYSVEAAGTYGPLFMQGEYFWFNIQRDANTGLPPIGAPDLKFQGGYGQVGYVLTGETHPYNAAAAAYGGIKPAHPFDINGGGWGAWEIAARYSTMDLNNLIGTTTGVAGGRQNVVTVGLNWYANSNVRLMFDYLHGDISKQIGPTNFGDAGSKFDAFAMRTQVAF
jgi:phosphate-selective porin OprO and OprP